MNINSKTRERGYTLIELMVVIVILAMILVGMIGLFLTNMKLSGRTTALAKVKQEGDYVSTTLERTIKYADRVYTGSSECTCETNMSSLCYTNDDINYQLAINNGVLTVSSLAGGDSKELTSVAVIAQSLVVNCEPATPSRGAMLRIQFTLADLQNLANETFTTRLVMRNR